VRAAAVGRGVAALCLLVAAAAGGCAWIGSSEKPDALVRDGRDLYLAHRYDEAIVKLERATELDSSNWTAHLYLARSYMAKGNWTLAIAEARLAHAAQPDDEDVKQALSAALLGGGSAAVHTQQFTLAIADFSEYIGLHPNDARGFLGLGEADVGAGRYASALGAFTRGIEIDRTGAVKEDLLRGLLEGGTHALHGGEAKEAVPLLKEYLQINPTNATAYLALARALLETGNEASAREALDHALLLDPRQPDAAALRSRLR
jgi:tetratricopeptide (TPR) repeat protein